VLSGTHSEYVTLIAYLLQQRLRERTSMLQYTYNACVEFILCCVSTDLCDELITRPGSPNVCVREREREREKERERWPIPYLDSCVT